MPNKFFKEPLGFPLKQNPTQTAQTALKVVTPYHQWLKIQSHINNFK